MSALEGACPIAVKAYHTCWGEIGELDLETWSATEPLKVSIGQAW